MMLQFYTSSNFFFTTVDLGKFIMRFIKSTDLIYFMISTSA